jgi:hypothetical protein
MSDADQAYFEAWIVSKESTDIAVKALKKITGTPELADLLGKNSGAIRGLLWKVTDDGQVRTENGRYVTSSEKKDNAA